MEKKIAVVGLGYVGLPLAVEFANQYPTVGFDINGSRVDELMNGYDRTLEVKDEDLNKVIALDLISVENNGKGLYCSTALGDIQSSNIYIITVPTPTDKNKRPLLTPLIKASESVGKVLKKDDYVIYESTVYPGVTEDECVPILEKFSGLKFNKDFFVGYSPERINPGDKERTLTKIIKVTSGSTPEAARVIDDLYKSIITVGTHLAPSIKVAESSKVIENSQRDINIAFVNELSKIFSLLNIDTQSVLEAAGTKWNFLPFKPGLVGGHCIGVDPYYLAQKAQETGYYPEIILAGIRINDSMGSFIASQVVKKMIQSDINIKEAKVLLLGITFKEDCPDIRNTRIIDIFLELTGYGIDINVYDPIANPTEVFEEYNLKIEDTEKAFRHKYDCIILAVPHKQFLCIDYEELKKQECSIVFDVKGVLSSKKGYFRL
jgi:UDP-N-acetyl-D-galactosamine dehydrogenase